MPTSSFNANERESKLVDPTCDQMPSMITIFFGHEERFDDRSCINARESQVAANWMAKHIRDFKKGYAVAQISLQDTVSEVNT